tara:strand:+ start:1017 stop:2339 length:1323 start_codon:yes stop_codon:yes gene_type:complete
MNITVFGCGYVGLVTSACFADLGHKVCCFDIDSNKIQKLNNGEINIYEPGLKPMVLRNQNNKRLKFSSKIDETIKFSDFIFICVGTPEKKDGSADLNFVKSVVGDIASKATSNKVVVIKSTVPPGSVQEIQNIFNSQLRKKNISVRVASNPEFLREGSAIRDFLKPDRVIIGVQHKELKSKFGSLYSSSHFKEKIIFMDTLSAELTKYASNAMLATKISFINEIANISDLIGADIDFVKAGIASDKRIGSSFINPGAGYGGSCFPKDVKALISKANDFGYKPKLLKATDAVNKKQKLVIFNKIVKRFGGDLKGMKFAVWGLSFKPETDDVRESPSIEVIKNLIKLGSSVSVFDPKASENFKRTISKNDEIEYMESKESCLENSDALIIMTEWINFEINDYSEIKSLLNRPIIFDSRNFLDKRKAISSGFEYFGIGRRGDV